METEYIQLPGKGMRSTGWISASRSVSTLYLGKDHLLQVDTVGGYSEEYKRFYFRDIQAITLHKTSKAVSVLFTTGILTLVFALLGISVQNEIGAGIAYTIAGVIGLIFILLLIAFVRGGTSCVCYVKTAVQTDQMPSLNRIRTAQKIFDRIQPLIEAAQGAITSEEIKQKLENPAHPNALASGGYAPPVMSREKVIRPYESAAHTALFSTMLLMGLLTVVYMVFHPPWYIGVLMAVQLAPIICSIVALVKQAGTDLGSSVRKAAYAATGLSIAYAFISYMAGTVFTAAMDQPMRNEVDMIDSFSEVDPLQNIWTGMVAALAALIPLGIGIVGFLQLHLWRKNKAQQVSTAVPENQTTP